MQSSTRQLDFSLSTAIQMFPIGSYLTLRHGNVIHLRFKKVQLTLGEEAVTGRMKGNLDSK